MHPSYLAYAGMEAVAWNSTRDLRPVFANRKGNNGRRDEIAMG